MRSYIIILFCILAGAIPVLAAPQVTIAVIDLEPQGIPAHEATLISDKLRANLANAPVFKVMERGRMEAVLKEQGVEQAGPCTDAGCVMQRGKMLSVQNIMTGTVGVLGSTHIINVKLTNVATGEILFSREEQVAGSIEDLFNKAVPDIASQVAYKMTIITQNIGYLSVVSEPGGAAIQVDGKIKGTTPLKNIEITAGDHRVLALLDNYAAPERTVTVETGKYTGLTITLAPTVKFYVKQKEESSIKKVNLAKTLRIASLAVGAAALAGTVYFSVSASRSYSSYSGSKDPDEAGRLWNDVRSSENKRSVFIGVAVAGAIGAGVSFAF